MKFKRVALYLALGSATGHAFDPVLKGGSVVLSDNNATLRTDLAERSLDSAMKVFLKGILETVLQGRTVVEGLTCTICRELLVGLKGLAASGNEAVSDGLEKMCSIVMVAAEVHLISASIVPICHGLVRENGPVLAESLRAMKEIEKSDAATLFCSSLFQVCPRVQPAWAVPLSEVPVNATTQRPKPSAKNPIQIVHYSDIHVDTQYVVGSNAECSNPILCCRSWQEEDEPGNNNNPAGPYGHIKTCDPPPLLEKSMFEAIEKFAPNAVFSMFTGDVIERQVWNSSIQTNKKQLHRAYGNMSNYFDLVYPVMGNHDSSPVNVYPYTEAPSALDTQWLYNTVADEWKRWTGGSSSDDIHFLGHYSSKFPHGNLRIISLNTNFYYRANFWMYRDPLVHDPKDQLTWLVAQLDAAEKATENVYIIGHMPMGDKDVFRHHSNYFDQIVRRYRSTIAAMFFGHTHVDQFEVSYTDYQNRTADNAMAISYIAPSLTPSDGMPSFRIYDVDPETFAVLDATTYITDMNDPSYDRGPTWKKYYSAKEAYGSLLSPPVTDTEAELSPAFWHRVTEELESDDSAFKAYFERKRRGWNDISCDVVCKKEEICQLRAGRTEDNCQVDKPGFHISKRRDGGTPESARGSPHHCGDSHTAGILAALVDPNHRDTVIKLLEAELSMLD